MEVSSPFGSRTRTRVLLALSLLEQSYSRELARLLEDPVSVIQKAILSLEKDALVSVRSVGRTRAVTLNPRYFAARELLTFLRRLAEADGELGRAVARLRRRPRRTGKTL